MLRFLLAFTLLTLGTSLLAQTPDTLDAEPRPFIRRSSIVPLPLAFYTPETGWGGGAAGMYAFRFRDQSDSARPSQFQLAFAYTQRRQLLLYFPFQVFTGEDARYNFYGELGYYRYLFYFYGIGNDNPDQSEIYTAAFPRMRVTAQRKWGDHWYAGLRYWGDNYRITEVDSTGQLYRSGITGATGGRTSGLGMVATYDSRDKVFFPREGVLAELVLLSNQPWLGSDFQYSRVSLDVSTYFTNRFRHTLAFNAWGNFHVGDVPFFEMATIGGTRKMRGFFEGRFRDRHVWMLQAEYRMPELWWRLGAVAFASVGNTADSLAGLTRNQAHYTAGVGLRFLLSKAEQVNIRIDYGINEEGKGFPYITVTEAF